MLTDQAAELTTKYESEQALLKHELAGIESKKRKAYDEKLEGKIAEEFWQEMNNVWEEHRARIVARLDRLQTTSPATFMPTMRCVLELAKRLPSLLFSMEPEKRRSLVNLVCLNLLLDVETLHVDYQKPFDLLAKKPENKIWGG